MGSDEVEENLYDMEWALRNWSEILVSVKDKSKL